VNSDPIGLSSGMMIGKTRGISCRGTVAFDQSDAGNPNPNYVDQASRLQLYFALADGVR
jgi:hypothetical protein